MNIPRPKFCTVVSPDEYDYIEQFKNSFEEANNFHKRIQNNPPAPFFAIDMGKVYGLLLKIDEQARQIADLEADNAQLREALGKAGIALRFYEDWMKTHEDGTRYPYGIETEQMISVLAGAR